MEAVYHSSGMQPVTKDMLNKEVNGLANEAAQLFRTIPWIPSGPAALPALTFLNDN